MNWLNCRATRITHAASGPLHMGINSFVSVYGPRQFIHSNEEVTGINFLYWVNDIAGFFKFNINKSNFVAVYDPDSNFKGRGPKIWILLKWRETSIKPAASGQFQIGIREMLLWVAFPCWDEYALTLQNAAIVTKCGVTKRVNVTKCGDCYKMWRLLQNAA